MADPVAMLQSVLDPEMPLSERAAIKAAIDEIERLRNMIREYISAETASCPPDDRESFSQWVQRSEDAWNALLKEADHG